MGPEFYEVVFQPAIREALAGDGTNRSETPSARTGSQRGADGDSQVLITAAGRPASRWLSRRRFGRRGLDRGRCPSTLGLPRRTAGRPTRPPPSQIDL